MQIYIFFLIVAIPYIYLYMCLTRQFPCFFLIFIQLQVYIMYMILISRNKDIL